MPLRQFHTAAGRVSQRVLSSAPKRRRARARPAYLRQLVQVKRPTAGADQSLGPQS